MLGKQKIINKKEQNAIVSGLKAIERDIEKKRSYFQKIRRYSYEYRKFIV